MLIVGLFLLEYVSMCWSRYRVSSWMDFLMSSGWGFVDVV